MKIDSMYEAMAVALLLAAKKKRTEAWMTYSAFWLARQQIFNLQEYWFQLGARIYMDLSEDEKSDLSSQLSKEEDRYVAEAKEWPEIPERLSELLPLKAKKATAESLEDLQAKLLRRIDSEAVSHLPEWPGPQLAALRAQKVEQARLKLAIPSVPDAQIPYIVSESEIEGIGEKEAAERILARADKDNLAAVQIESLRRIARKGVMDAKTIDEANAAATVEWSS